MSDVTFIDGTPIDSQGNPLVEVGCPNCNAGKGFVDGFSFAAAMNSGRDLTAPCSRRCALQIEYAESLRSDTGAGR